MRYMVFALAAVFAAEAMAAGTGLVERLTGNIVPTRYRLDIATQLTRNFSFTGEVWIDVTVEDATQEIWLHSKDLKIVSANVVKLKGNQDIVIDNKVIVSSSFLNLKSNKSELPSLVFPGSRTRTGDDDIATDESAGDSDMNVKHSTGSSFTSVPFSETVVPDVTENNESAFLSQIYDIFQQPTVSTVLNVRPQKERENKRGLKRKQRYFAKVSATFSVASLPVAAASNKREAYEDNPTVVPADLSMLNKSGNVKGNNSADTRGGSRRRYVVSDIIVDKDRQMVKLRLMHKLENKSKYRVYLKYTGELSDDNTGYYKSSYGSRKKNETSWMATTVFEPTGARRAFPCFDEPHMKAVFQVNLARPIGVNTLSNTERIKTTPLLDRPGWEVDSYAETPPMSTYLVAFFVGRLDERQANTSDGKQFRVWTRPTVRPEQTQYALDVGPKLEQYLEKYTSIKNPLNKTDLLALPTFISDALENWGLISFDEKYLLYQPGVSTLASKQTVTTALAHELAHTWFGNLVTTDWWTNIWLNEGFAVYFGANAVDAVHPEWEFKNLQSVKAFLKVFSIDALRTSHPLIPTVEKYEDMDTLFDSITYYKGYYLLRMVQGTLGEATFQAGVRKYLQERQFGSAHAEDPWLFLGQQAWMDGTLSLDMQLTDIMANWTKLPGYPLVSVFRNYDEGTIDLLQNRFLRSKDDIEARQETVTEDVGWWVPLTYTTQEELLFNDTSPRFWLDPSELVSTVDQGVPSADHWVIFNIRATGLYRVNYDRRNWEMLTSHLNSVQYSDIDVLNRAQLVDDALDLARAGDVPYPLALQLTSYMRREQHYLPWLATFNNMDYLQRMLRASTARQLFQRFVQFLVTPIFEQLGFESRGGESSLATLNRQQVVWWACQAGVTSCVQHSVQLFREWMDVANNDSDSNPIASNLRLAVYCTAIEHGGEEEWAFLWLKYLTTTVSSERAAALAALGCTRKLHILQKYLDLSVLDTSGLRKKDKLSVFKAVSKNELGLDLAVQFLKDNLNTRKFVGEERTVLPVYIDSLTATMNKEEQLLQVEELIANSNGVLRSNSQPVQMANEKLKFNIQWIESNLDSIASWLKQRDTVVS